MNVQLAVCVVLLAAVIGAAKYGLGLAYAAIGAGPYVLLCVAIAGLITAIAFAADRRAANLRQWRSRAHSDRQP